MELLEIPLVGDIKENQLPSPEEYTYWKDRENRTFYIDYEIDEAYYLVELAKIIIQINIEEKDIENPDPIRLFIHSYGGDIEQALFFCDLVKASRIPIITIGMGVAMSAGFLIFYLVRNVLHFPIPQCLCIADQPHFKAQQNRLKKRKRIIRNKLNR